MGYGPAMRCLFAILVLLALTIPAAAADVTPIGGSLKSEPLDGYVLTVGGKTFTNADLEDMWLYQADMETAWGPSGTFVGPKLDDVLAAGGICACGDLKFEAADGYAIEVSHFADGYADAMIATRLNGEALPLDGFGPFWLIWPTRNDAVLADESEGALWIWSLVKIGE